MALSTKAIRKSIRSIGNTKKITKAMEMVAAAKMRKAVMSVLSSRSYANAAWQMILNLADKVDQNTHPLLAKREKVQNIAIILITSNRGLCGGFNSQIISFALNQVAKDKVANQPISISWLTLGKKGSDFLARNQKTIVADFEKPDLVASASEVTTLAKLVAREFQSGIYDKVLVAYTDYKSAMIQKPRVKQLLPLEQTIDTELGSVISADAQPVEQKEAFEYLFEPNPAEVLNRFLPHLIEIQLYQALLESNASEHSARMLAMKNASAAASDMIDSLTLAYNQARQAGITREIAEITGGKAALEQ
jgi:F-type H+-transporting ATPase subunit gamma